MIAAFCVNAVVVHGDRPKAETYRRLAQLCSAKDLDQAIAVAVSLLPDLAPAEVHTPLGAPICTCVCRRLLHAKFCIWLFGSVTLAQWPARWRILLIYAW